jgi:hypothetical protein
MTIVATRFIDFFRPGDTIPDGTYDAETLAGMIANGQAAEQEFRAIVEPTEEADEPAAAEKAPARSRKNAKK